MRTGTLKRITAVVITAVITASVSPNAYADGGVKKNGSYYEVTSAEELSDKTFPCYFADGTTLKNKTHKGETELTFLDGQNDIPYIGLENAALLICDTARYYFNDKKLKVTCEQSDGKIVMTRENGSTAVFDPKKDVISFKEYEKFMRPSYSEFNSDKVNLIKKDASGRSRYIYQCPNRSYEIKGGEVSFDLASYRIHMIEADGEIYIPLQTLSDLFISRLSAGIYFNGKIVFIGKSINNYDDIKKLYYSSETGKRSKELAMFTYQELCLALDTHYGIKNEHDIDNFDRFFRNTGLYKGLTDNDGGKFDDAIFELCVNCFADFHSLLTVQSPYAGEEYDIKTTITNPNVIDYVSQNSYFKLFRAKFFPQEVPSYQEVGDTAFITLDNFIFPKDGTDYYFDAPDKNAKDTVGIIMYAHSQITRKNSPVKNVVLDLSCNSGGELDAAVYTAAWFLGYCTVNMENTLTGSKGSLSYQADTNRDRKFDLKDNLSDRNLYCLISPNTFSAGNLVASIFKESGRVAVIGKPSGGGACIVQPLTAADGSAFECSGNCKVMTVINGSYYDIDRGITPDYMIDKADNFFRRKKLAEYIKDLF